MTSTTKQALSAQDLALIIMTCHQSGVTSFEYEKVRILFGHSETLVDVKVNNSLTSPEQNINNSTKPELSDTPIQSDSMELDEEDRLVHLMLSDAEAYEDLVRAQA